VLCVGRIAGMLYPNRSCLPAATGPRRAAVPPTAAAEASDDIKIANILSIYICSFDFRPKDDDK
jgi:hypothetical protein